MKKFFKKCKTLFMFLLIIPMMFVFVACKNGNDNDNNNNGSNGTPGIEQPGGEGSGEGDETPGGGDEPGGGEDGGEDPEPPPVEAEKTFNLSVNYSLPTYLQGLKTNESLTPEINEGYTLPTFVETEYEDYFDGWFTTETYEVESKVETLKLVAEENANVTIFAKWKVTEMEEFFCTSGVEFSFNGNCAIPIAYTGTSEIVIIPKSVMNGDTKCYVDRFGANCFQNNSVITELRTSMTDFAVGSNAFENSTLEAIDFSKIVSLDNYAFKGSKVKNAVFSNKLAELSPAVFYDCEELISLDLSAVTNVVVSLLPSSFCYGCEKLTSIDLSTRMTKISESAFEGCASLENVNFLQNSSITEIANRAFANCTKLDNIVIPESIVSYGTAVFAGCSIKNMTISNMFYNEAIADFTFSTRFGDLSSTLKSVTFTGTGITKIYNNYFSGYSELETLIMNNQVAEIGSNAFYGCSKLENITFSNALVGDKLNISTLTSTKWYTDIEAYLEEESLDSMVVNGTLVYISSDVTGAFVVGENVTHIAADIFGTNQNITSVSISKNVVYINKYAFYKSKVTSISVDALNVSYKVNSGTLEKLTDDENEHENINYCALYELDGSGKENVLISYVADKNGGLFVVAETVSLVYNSAFNSNKQPQYVYMSKENSSVDLTTKFLMEEKAPTRGYLFGDATITKTGTNPNASIFNFLSADHYSYGEQLDVNYTGLSGNYFAIVVFEGIPPEETIYEYYLIDADNKQVINVIEIYPSFVI